MTPINYNALCDTLVADATDNITILGRLASLVHCLDENGDLSFDSRQILLSAVSASIEAEFDSLERQDARLAARLAEANAE